MKEIETQLAAAEAALDDFAKGPARRAADAIGASFEQAGARIARALGRAAGEGEEGFRRMARVILEELAKIALQRLFANAGAAVPSKPPTEALGFSSQTSARSNPAAPGFGAVAVHFHLGVGADVGGVSRHQGQIAAAVARAVSYGRRNL